MADRRAPSRPRTVAVWAVAVLAGGAVMALVDSLLSEGDGVRWSFVISTTVIVAVVMGTATSRRST